MNKTNDIGMTYARLTIMAYDTPFVAKSGQKRTRVICDCSCGGSLSVVLTYLKNGNTKSCGCLHKEKAGRPRSHPDVRVNGIRTREYVIWCGMRKRCRNPNDRHYKMYGGRGITVCEQWDNFHTFMSDMGKAPSEKHSIDRINNYDGYNPQNCRWATSKEQSRNRRSTIYYEKNGMRMVMQDWCKYLGIVKGTFQYRIKTGQSFDKIYDDFIDRLHPQSSGLPPISSS